MLSVLPDSAETLDVDRKASELLLA